jgi:hypothetical protein
VPRAVKHDGNLTFWSPQAKCVLEYFSATTPKFCRSGFLAKIIAVGMKRTLYPTAMKVQTLTLVLLLLGATCIAPGMAGSQTSFVEDGVHLIKSDDSPTVLDPSYYKNMLVTTDFIVDGDQYYWVRIGNVKADGLTSAWWVDLAVLLLVLELLMLTIVLWYYGVKHYFSGFYTTMVTPLRVQGVRSFVKHLLVFLLPVVVVGTLILSGLLSGGLHSFFNHAACGDFVDLKASDGTILLSVDKLHPETNTLYMKSGRNITNLYHIPCSGNSIQNYGVSPP